MTVPGEAPRRWAFSLGDAMEALKAEDLVILTKDQSDEVVALLGELAFERPDYGTPWRNILAGTIETRAIDILAAWPGYEMPDEEVES